MRDIAGARREDGGLIGYLAITALYYILGGIGYLLLRLKGKK
jgi:hypothetical protein